MKMRRIVSYIPFLLFSLLLDCFPAVASAKAAPSSKRRQHSFAAQNELKVDGKHNISADLFAELEEFARIVDITYCVGTTGIRQPFECVSRCGEFEGFELVDTWNTGPLLSDSCGYIVVDHGVNKTAGDDGKKIRRKDRGKRIIVAFRGTYSIASTIVDLATVPQEYVPYPGGPDDHDNDRNNDDDSEDENMDDGPHKSWLHRPWGWLRHRLRPGKTRNSKSMFEKRGTRENANHPSGPKCTNCTVHTGFYTSWRNTRPVILPYVKKLKHRYPGYKLHLVGHSLGGAVATLAALEFEAMGLEPIVTTFGEPRVGNLGLRDYIDEMFDLAQDHKDNTESGAVDLDLVASANNRYRRLTHNQDPIPLLPLTEWGFRMHAGEIYISKAALQPSVHDLRLCDGDEDLECIAGAETSKSTASSSVSSQMISKEDLEWAINAGLSVQQEDIAPEIDILAKRWGLPARFRMWQLFFAHRDYFWRLGLCVPGGDPADWGRGRYGDGDGGDNDENQMDL